MYRPAASEIVRSPGCIQIRGARQNNLKGFDLDVPLGKLNVISGPSGSGKSSLAFDTIYAEGQRRYVETFSPYTRQFLDRMDKPAVDEICGIPPAIAIEQSNSVKSSRSTIGTMTEINDYLKLLFPKLAKGFCPECQREVRPETNASIVEHAQEQLGGKTVLVTFPVPVPAGTKPADFFEFIQKQGYVRVWIEGNVLRADESGKARRLPAIVQVVQDRLTVTPDQASRLSEAIATALAYGKGQVALIEAGGTVHPFSSGWHCAHCDIAITPPSPSLFSFNNPIGACPSCRGFGRVIGIDIERGIPDRSLSISEGVVKPFQTENGRECQRDLLKACRQEEIDIHTPFEELPKRDQEFVLYGADRTKKAEELWTAGRWYGVRGFFEWLETKSYKMHVRVLLSRYRNYTTCPDCGGGRLQPAALNFRVDGKTLPELSALPVGQFADLTTEWERRVSDNPPCAMLAGEVRTRLRYLVEVGLGYLSLDRATRTLSGGEVERVNLTTCLGASLVNTLFVMDEPSVGLHPRDVSRLVRVMKGLRDKGNTLLVVEHDEAVLRAADHLIELGPGRGESGGEVVFEGAPAGNRAKRSLTLDYLSGRKSIPVPKRRRTPAGQLKVDGARQHNLHGIDVQFPLGVFTCVTGVSGSGKSTLVHDVLYRNLLREKGGTLDEEAGGCRRITGTQKIRNVVMVDQSPLSRTPRSSVALYLGVYDGIRAEFAMVPEAVQQGHTASTFSFNSGTGRCPRCSGTGYEKIEMQFLSDLYIRCPECEGTRFQPHVLKIKVRGLSVHEVLQLTVTEAVQFFEHERKIAGPLRILEEVGLGYLRLGQPLNTLSGGESQRLKLVSHLAGQEGNGNLLIFDEPTTGLHFDDIAMLLRVFDRLVEQGNSLLVIEHNLEVIKCADHIIDLGPEAGEAGGTVIATGTPEEIVEIEESHTGRFLRPMLEKKRALYSAEEELELARVAETAPRYNAAANSIYVTGAREHNLKNLTVSIPRDQMVVITGLSGSGKSTLAFDILFAEGQRRFLDSMSPYARQFAEQLQKPDVDLITGLPPTVAIEQRVTRGGGKSTVATVTEVYHFVRLLFAKLGTLHCPKCQLPVAPQTPAAIEKQIRALARKGPIRLLAPLVKARKGFHTDVAKWAVRHGFDQLLVDGQFVSAHGFKKLERFKEHTIDVLAGESVKDLARALEIGQGTIRILDAKNRFTVLSTSASCPGCGASFEPLDPRLFSFNSPHGWCPQCRGFGEIWQASVNPRSESVLEQELDEERQHEWLDESEAACCPDCNGARLNEVARNVRIQGQTITDFTHRSVRNALADMARLKFTGSDAIIARDVLPEIRQRLDFMGRVGLDYLTLDRSAKTLSGGESQRIRLAAQLGSNLKGVLYVLDEPTIGLHPRDNQALLDTLDALKAKGNSLVIVEHDEDTMRRADTIVDLGPAAGIHGGEITAIGSLDDICKNPASQTGYCLRHALCHPTTGKRRSLDDCEHWLELRGAHANNLKNIDVKFPVGRFTVITGISGSGKSTLMRQVLGPSVTALKQRPKRKTRNGATNDLPVKTVLGHENIETVYEVDQSPIGKTTRSTPATYIKLFDEVRKQFAQLPLSRMRGYTASRFSFNNEGGRCEACQGQGTIKVEMAFLPTSYIPCTECGGKRFNASTLEVLYNDKSIGDVLEMTLEEASEFFSANPSIHRPLRWLCDTGLGYLKLGQPSPTLSGGEAQRLKLVSELVRGVARDETSKLRRQRAVKSILYLLEEPTIGLHMADVAQLLKVIHRLVDAGHTVVIIEHNLSVIADADYIIDVGPEAGEAGGQIVAAGSPEEVAKSRISRTAPFIRDVLKIKAKKK